MATFIRDVLRTPQHFEPFILNSLDTSDRRDASNLGLWDATNLALGFSNLADMASRMRRQQHTLVYIPISQNIPAFLRDALFVLQARCFGARVVLHLHGGHFRTFYDQETPGWFRVVARWILNQAAAVAVLSPDFKPIFEGLIPSERIHVVENGVPDLFSESLLLNRPPNTLLYMSTLSREKGFLDLIRALPRIRESLPSIRLRIAGSGTDDIALAEAHEVIKRENLRDAIDFVGNVDGPAKRNFLLSGSLFCLPTRYRYEGQPLAILEAMSAGLPVLSTQHGAIASTIQDGVTGRLLAPDVTPEDIADSVCAMLADPEKLRAQRIAARTRYLDMFTLEHCHRRLTHVFKIATK
ncbi:MAG: glycosyltransferase family 4 protein [Planctomycetota bacterium]